MKLAVENKGINLYMVLGVLAILFYTLPYILLGQNAAITIHDFLDLTIGHINNIVKNGQFFALSGTLPIMDGVDRMGIPFTTPFEIKNLLYYIIPGYWSIIITMIFVKTVAFVGMFFLLKDYIIKKQYFICFFVALVFSLIPFYIDYSLSSAGIPLLTYSLFNIYNKRNKLLSYIIIIIYAFNSSLSLSGLFVGAIIFLVIILLYMMDKRINKELSLALLSLVVIYAITNWVIISSFFFPTEFVSHRNEMQMRLTNNEILGLLISNLKSGHYHAGLFSAYPIIIVFLSVFFIYRKQYTELKYFFYSFLILAVLVELGVTVKLIQMQLFVSFQFDRFYFLYPSLCFILLAKSCSVLADDNKWIILAFVFLVSVYSINNAFTGTEYRENVKKLVSNTQVVTPSYAQYYDEPLFKQISNDLSLTQDYTTKVASVGLHPSIAEYNGFWTLDSYMTNYSLDYKHKFRKVIAGELAKNETLRKYFDGWGNRCYIFSSELDERGNRYLSSKNDHFAIDQLDVNTEALKSLGCEYIISSVDIKNHSELNLSFINKYTTNQSFWEIRVYRLE